MVTLFDTYSQNTVFKRLSIIIHGMTLDKSLTGKLTHSYRASVSTLDGRRADTAVSKKKKTIETGCFVDPKNNRRWSQQVISLWDGSSSYYHYNTMIIIFPLLCFHSIFWTL